MFSGFVKNPTSVAAGLISGSSSISLVYMSLLSSWFCGSIWNQTLRFLVAFSVQGWLAIEVFRLLIYMNFKIFFFLEFWWLHDSIDHFCVAIFTIFILISYEDEMFFRFSI